MSLPPLLSQIHPTPYPPPNREDQRRVIHIATFLQFSKGLCCVPGIEWTLRWYRAALSGGGRSVRGILGDGGVLLLRGVTRVQFATSAPLCNPACISIMWGWRAASLKILSRSTFGRSGKSCNPYIESSIKSASLDITDVDLSYSENELQRFQCEGGALQGWIFWVDARLGDENRGESPCCPGITSVCTRRLALDGIVGSSMSDWNRIKI
jgi:hypothetical protein